MRILFAEGLMSDIQEKRRAYLARLEEIRPEITITSMVQVRDPKTLEWCVQQIESGRSYAELQRLVGLHGKPELWRQLRALLVSFYNPKDEIQALTDYYLEQAEIVNDIKSDIEELTEKIKAGPNDRVAKNTKGEEFVVEDKSFNSLYEIRIKARKIIADEMGKKYQGFLDHKKSKDGHGKYQGATIHIHSNVPRPSLKEAEKALGEEEEDC
jgi:hypothetical protein